MEGGLDIFGGCIDRFALAALGTAGVYLLLLRLGLPVALCALMALAISIAAGEGLRHLPRRNRATPAQARAALTAIALLPEAEALDRLRTLTAREDLRAALRHPSARLDAAGAYDLWRRHGDGACVAITCPADPAALRFARGRGMTLIDAPALEKRLRQTGMFIPPGAPRRPLSDRLAALLDRPASPKAALYGLSLVGMYQLTGLTLTLLAGLMTLAVTGLRWIRARA